MVAAQASAVGTVSSIARVPVAARSHHQHVGGVGAPGAGAVGLGLHMAVDPGLGHAVDPFPGLFGLVAPHEQGGIAVQGVEQQALVGDPAARRISLSLSLSIENNLGIKKQNKSENLLK